MYCIKCGSEVPGESAFCPNCGAPVAPRAPSVAPRPPARRRALPLAADPTVQYALAEDPESVTQFGYWKSSLASEDLNADSPYNTYRIAGPPPTPIAAPSLDSIQAAIRPADANYLYYLVKPDGSHLFAETLEEHQRNIEVQP